MTLRPSFGLGQGRLLRSALSIRIGAVHVERRFRRRLSDQERREERAMLSWGDVIKLANEGNLDPDRRVEKTADE